MLVYGGDKHLKKDVRNITISGSEGIIGKQLCDYFVSFDNIKLNKLDVVFGHDLVNEKFVRKWFKENPTEHLINCFALNDHVSKKRKKQTLFDFSLKQFSRYMEVNLTALFSVCREFARNNKKGTIVNFSSTYGILSPSPHIFGGSHKDIGYTVSKAGVVNLTKYLAVHLAPNIRVNCVVPQGILAGQDKKFVKRLSSLIPLGRMMNKNELNELIDYLSSDKSSFITGSAIIVDGGYTSW